jgi:HEAT repeat protein
MSWSVITDKEPSHPSKDWLEFGSALPGNKISFTTELLMGTMVKEEFLDYVSIISPLIIAKSSDEEVRFRYIIKFKDEGGWRQIEASLIPMEFNTISKIVKDKKAEMVKRIFAINWLTEIKDSRIGEIILPIVSDEEDRNGVRASGIIALGYLKYPKSVDSLLEILRNEDESIWLRKTAADSLGYIGGGEAISGLIELIEPIDLKDEGLIQEIICALGRCGDVSAVDPLLRILKNEDKSIELRASAARSLGNIGGKKIIPELLEVITSEEEELVEAAIYALGECNDASVVEPLIKILKDNERSNLHHSVAESLSKLKEKSAVLPLITLAKKKEAKARLLAIEILGNIGDKESTSALVPLLKDENDKVREEVATTLDKLNWTPKDDTEKVYYFIAKQQWDKCVKFGKVAVKPLIKILKDENTYIREAAAKALGEIGAIEAAKPLIETLNDEEYVREVVIESLVKIGKPIVPLLLEYLGNRDENIRAGIAKVLGKIGNNGTKEDLINALKDESKKVQVWVNFALYKLGITQKLDTLISWLKDKDEDLEIRIEAAKALGETGDRRVIELLTNIAKDEEEQTVLRDEVIEALYKIDKDLGDKIREEVGFWG